MMMYAKISCCRNLTYFQIKFCRQLSVCSDGFNNLSSYPQNFLQPDLLSGNLVPRFHHFLHLCCVYTIQLNWFPAVGLCSVYIVHCTVCTLYNLTGLLAWLNPRHVQYTCICLGIDRMSSSSLIKLLLSKQCSGSFQNILSFLPVLTLGQPGLSRGFVDFFLIFKWDRQTDRQTDGQTDRQTDRQT